LEGCPARLVRTALDALAVIHEELWDEACSLVRLAPGVTPGVDLSDLDLHSVRESALGAYFDFSRGHTQRATAALRAVLATQWRQPDAAWSGSFPVVREQARPALVGAREWVDYDPNWRQFLGVILAILRAKFSELLDFDLSDEVDEAISWCVAGEPDARIADTYTNPNLLSAWLSAHEGVRGGRSTWVESGLNRAQRIMERLRHFGDVDEYNSPTYDGIDLLAVALWIAYPPTEEFFEWGHELRTILRDRISNLFHPELAVTAGPYARAYGVTFASYVSLLGIWIAVSGGESTLPSVLTRDTEHVHDLYFGPVIVDLARESQWTFVSQPVHLARSHTQRFGAARSTSRLSPNAAIGVDEKNRGTFARDQYVPVMVTSRGKDSSVGSLGIYLGGESHIDGYVVVDGLIEVVLRGNENGTAMRVRAEPLSIDGDVVTSGPISFELPEGDVEHVSGGFTWRGGLSETRFYLRYRP